MEEKPKSGIFKKIGAIFAFIGMIVGAIIEMVVGDTDNVHSSSGPEGVATFTAEDGSWPEKELPPCIVRPPEKHTVERAEVFVDSEKRRQYSAKFIIGNMNKDEADAYIDGFFRDAEKMFSRTRAKIWFDDCFWSVGAYSEKARGKPDTFKIGIAWYPVAEGK